MLTNKVPEQDVHDLFTRVAPKYDLMNNIVSLGIQKSWRKKFLRQLDLNKNSICLDLCCGSADSPGDVEDCPKKDSSKAAAVQDKVDCRGCNEFTFCGQ